MIDKIKKFFFPTKIKLQPGHELEVAFISGGVEYSRFVNDFNLPILRAMAALDINKELEERTDIKYHKLSYKLIIEYLQKGENINAGIVANNSLERMDNICNLDLVYKLASVLYLAPGENPYSYDYEIAEKKIKTWKKDQDITDFFLSTPLAAYIPSFDGLEINIHHYTEAQRRNMLSTLKSHLSKLSEKSNQIELISTLKSQIKELEELLSTN